MQEIQLEKAYNLIKDARKVAVVPSSAARTDAFSAGVGMYYMLSDLDKDVSLIYPSIVPEKARDLIEQDRITNSLIDRELIVEIDYSGTKAGSAQYSTNNHKLQVRIGPVSKNFDVEDKIRARLTGFDFDAVVVIGAQRESDLGEGFGNLRDTFEDAKIINIDHLERNEEFGDANLVDKEAISLSQQILKLGALWNIIPNEKAAKALLTGMTYRNGNYAGQ